MIGLETLGCKNKNARETIRNQTIQKTLCMSDMILKIFFAALNSNIDWTIQSLPKEITNKSMEFLQSTSPPERRIGYGRKRTKRVF